MERTEKILRDLYGAAESGRLAGAFTALIGRHSRSGTIRGGRTGALSHKDVILITYPDQVRAEGVAPLAVLEAFCARHLQGLIQFLHILPFFPSTSDDGFSITDYRLVDPALGTWDDISRLAGKFGLMMDAVLNHASAQSAWFQAFLRGDEPFRGFFIERTDPSGLELVVRPRTSPLLHRLGTPPMQKEVWTTFSGDQVDLNYRNPGVLLEMADLLLFYAARGASIIRLDAAAYLWKDAGTTCINLPQTHRIVQLLRVVLEAAAPGVHLATETNVSHADNISYAGDEGGEAHLIYNFALPPLVWHTFLTGDARVLSHWVEQAPAPGRKTVFLNFLASHDGIGLNAAREILPEADLNRMIRSARDRGGYVSLKQASGGAAEPYEININYFDALSDPFTEEPLEIQIRRFLGAHAILLSLAGVPGIYFHSLFGSRGWREGVQTTGRNRSVNREKCDRAILELELADESGIRKRIFSGLARLIRARSGNPAFDPYGSQRIIPGGGSVFALLRTQPRTGRRVLCLQEVSGTGHALDLDLAEIFGLHPPEAEWVDLAGGGRFPSAPPAPIRLEPYQTCWLTHCGDSSQSKKERADTA
jgi:glycosidase